MSNHEFESISEKASLPINIKDLLTIGFRYKRTLGLCFFGILTGAILAAIFQPAEYSASTRFLVGATRVDPVVSTDASPPAPVQPVSEEELNSEVELIHSPDVLRQVVISCELDKERTFLDRVFGDPTPERRIERATKKLGKDLQIGLVKKSNLIDVSYTSRDAQSSVQALKVLADAYLQKHVAVHSPPGQFEFFAQETERYKKNLSDAESQLKQFTQQEDGVAPQISRDIALQKLSEFHSTLQQTRAEIAATEQRIKTLEKQSGSTPERLTTSSRQLDDAQVLQPLKSTLMNLELKRTELLTKYQPSYPLVQEVDKQIGETQAAIVAEESKPIKEQTTDRNPTYAWITEELAKAKAEYSGLQARAAATQAIEAQYEAKTHDLAQKGLLEQDLQRTVKADEENYLLYLHKQEQARMSEALDRTRILNVAVAEQPVTPSLPSNSPLPIVLGGIFLGAVVSIGAVSAQEYLDPSFRTPAEVSAKLNIPVLAAVPHGTVSSNGNPRNGNGRDHEFSISDANSLSHLDRA
ncbi:MAG TPA: GumC family protein [Candidatus Acidoferrum sp.]|nr:GumC family protein [Candidatus Acidoferrum sp.]